MQRLALREFHPFEAGGHRFLYLVPSAGVVRLDEATDAVIRQLEGGASTPEEIASRLGDRFGAEEVRSTAAPRRVVIRLLPAAAPAVSRQRQPGSLLSLLSGSNGPSCFCA